MNDNKRALYTSIKVTRIFCHFLQRNALLHRLFKNKCYTSPNKRTILLVYIFLHRYIVHLMMSLIHHKKINKIRNGCGMYTNNAIMRIEFINNSKVDTSNMDWLSFLFQP